MDWFEKRPLSWLESFVIKVLKSGPIPRHVAFIMDGNRRYARRLKLDTMDGHIQGFEKLSQNLDWCLELGIKEVTIYAFSIENFKRSQEEVDSLMDLMREKFKKLLEQKEKVKENGVQIRVLGDLTLLPTDIQQTIAEIVLDSKENDSLFFNVCLSYTSREEMCSAAENIARGVAKGLLSTNDITEELFDQCLYNNSVPDIVVRTSGEVRLSDFLLWQSSYSLLSFLSILWPEFNIWHLFGAIWKYQHFHKYIKTNYNKSLQLTKKAEEREIYNQAMEAYRNEGGSEDFLPDKKLKEYKMKRQERIVSFLRYLKTERIRKLEKMKLGQMD